MNETLLLDILRESYEREYAEYDSIPEHKFSLNHRIDMKRIFAKYEKNVRKPKVNDDISAVSNGSSKSKPSFRQSLILAAIIIIFMAFIAG